MAITTLAQAVAVAVAVAVVAASHAQAESCGGDAYTSTCPGDAGVSQGAYVPGNAYPDYQADQQRRLALALMAQQSMNQANAQFQATLRANMPQYRPAMNFNCYSYARNTLNCTGR
ncbi:MAG TPA: hypothetical protein VGI28_01755 [Stellaceae bacterium]|jgi:hypothetical protein